MHVALLLRLWQREQLFEVDVEGMFHLAMHLEPELTAARVAFGAAHGPKRAQHALPGGKPRLLVLAFRGTGLAREIIVQGEQPAPERDDERAADRLADELSPRGHAREVRPHFGARVLGRACRWIREHRYSVLLRCLVFL